MVTTSPEWQASTCEVTANSLYNGQTIDARLRHGGEPLTVRTAAFDRARLQEQAAPLIRRHDVLKPRRVWQAPSGATLIDFGQNLVGWVRVKVTGPSGTTITVRHAEVLESEELALRPLRAAEATDTFILSGGEDFFEPTFTFHGFRYIEVTGWPGEVAADAIEAVAVHSSMARTSTFECSEPLVNQLVHNSIWGQKGNFLSIPTDCPQRDERLGWTGDIALYAPTACFQFDCADFLHSWLLDVATETEHHPKRQVPLVVPDLLKHANFPEGTSAPPEVGSQAVWGDAAVWVPQALWNAYGDVDRLAAHYPGMVSHLKSAEALLSPTGLWDTGFQLADWLDPDAPADQPWAAKADPGVVATASLYRSAAFTRDAAEILGEDTDSEQWGQFAQRVRTAFRTHYVEGDRITSDCATVYALALCFGLLEPTETTWAARRLSEIVRESGHVVTTGFAGTPYVTWALSEHGYLDDAYKLLLQTNCPSWLYPVVMGATTIWERWDSLLPDGSVNPGEMTSFNHYAFGADWIYQVVAGIRPAAPGYTKIHIQPRPGPGISWAKASLTVTAGVIRVGWHHTDDEFNLDLETPDVETIVTLPDGSTHTVTAGTHRFTVAASRTQASPPAVDGSDCRLES